jgi:hypothetical protein
VHPTTFFDRRAWNQPLGDAAANGFTDHLALPNQAGAFRSCCRLFAPRYRQASAGAFAADGPDG